MKLATEPRVKLNNGKEIPLLGLGTYCLGEHSEVKEQVKTAIKAGYRHIDGAWVYLTEKYVGEAINELIAEGIVTREELFVTTKIWPTFHTNPEEGLKQSLKDLNLDYVDLVLQHWPVNLACPDKNGKPMFPKNEDGSTAFDDNTSDETGFIEFYKNLEEMYLKNPDKVSSIGVSNYSISFLEKLLPVVKVKPVVNQIEYHPQLPQQDLVDYCTKNGIHITAYSPVGSNGAPVLKLPLLQTLAEKYGVTTNEIAIAYHILEGRSAIPRSSNLERIKTNIRLPELTTEELKQLYQIGVDKPKRYVAEKGWPALGFERWP